MKLTSLNAAYQIQFSSNIMSKIISQYFKLYDNHNVNFQFIRQEINSLKTYIMSLPFFYFSTLWLIEGKK